MIAIELTESDAALFREFCRVQDTLSILSEAGVFNVRNGKAVLNFDPNGVLTDIELNLKRYKRGHPVIHSDTNLTS